MAVLSSCATKISLFILIQLILSNSAICQIESETLHYITRYSFSHQLDSTDSKSKVTADMTLLLGNSISKYGSTFSIERFSNSLKLINKNESFRNLPVSNDLNVEGKPLAIVTPNWLLEGSMYQLKKENKLLFLTMLGMQSFKIEDELPKMKWHIIGQDSVFLGYRCVNANTTFAGRKYTAWFSPDLPFQAGPWKLNGLPGLILEAHDSKMEVQFRATSVEKVPPGIMIDREPLYIFSAIEKIKFLTLQKKFFKDPVASLKAQIPVTITGNIEAVYRNGHGQILTGESAKRSIEADRKKIINNPIELIH